MDDNSMAVDPAETFSIATDEDRESPLRPRWGRRQPAVPESTVPSVIQKDKSNQRGQALFQQAMHQASSQPSLDQHQADALMQQWHVLNARENQVQVAERQITLQSQHISLAEQQHAAQTRQLTVQQDHIHEQAAEVLRLRQMILNQQAQFTALTSPPQDLYNVAGNPVVSPPRQQMLLPVPATPAPDSEPSSDEDKAHQTRGSIRRRSPLLNEDDDL